MLHYQRAGSGDSLVLIHGFLGSTEVFARAVDKLQQHFDVIRIDLPGHGQSAVEHESYTVYSYAEEIAEVLKHEEIEHCTLLGHSMGGYIALAAYEKDLFAIEHLVLAYSSEKADHAEAITKRNQQKVTIAETGVKAFVDQVIENFLGPSATADQIEAARQVAYTGNADGLIAALGAMQTRPDQTELLANATLPILIIEGADDKVVKPIETANPDVQKVTTQSGHLGMLEDADAFAQVIIDFVKNQYGPDKRA